MSTSKTARIALASTPTPNYVTTREEWFGKVVDECRETFLQAGIPIPRNTRISCGFPSTGKNGKRLGECWKSSASGDDHYEIFVNPRLSTAKGEGSWITKGATQYLEGDLVVFGLVVHELIHASLWDAGHEKHGHGKLFKQACQDVGLKVLARNGATTMTEDGVKWGEVILKQVGGYPMAPIQTGVEVKKGQTTRMVLLLDPANSDYKLRMTREPITQYGLPKAPSGHDCVIDPLSAMKTEYTTDDLLEFKYAKRDGKELVLTSNGEARAIEIIDEIVGNS